MGLFRTVKNLLGRGSTEARHAMTPPVPPPVPPEEEQEEVVFVPEVDTPTLLETHRAGVPLYLLDVREQFEWEQVRIPAGDKLTVVHMPMNTIPHNLAQLPATSEIVVLCAHGNRSYGVTHYLREQGFQARNLIGGITQWQIRGGDVVITRR